MDDSDGQKFCLKWNNFQNNFMSQFEALKEDEDFVDVTLSCYGHSIKAHKVVLSACSPYLKNIFKEHPCKHPVIILDNLSFKNLESVIQFVYTGQVYVEQTDLSSFLKAAEALQIRGLSDSSTTQNLMKPVPIQKNNLDSGGMSEKREADDENELRKPPSKRMTRRVSCSSGKDSNESKDKEKDCNGNSESTKAEAVGGAAAAAAGVGSGNGNSGSSLNLLAEMECSIEIDKKELILSSKTEDYTTGEQKKPHWLDPRSCPLCNRVYSNLSNLRQHMKLIHNPTLVTCKLCYKTFKTDLYLRRHLISFHEFSSNGGNLVSLEPVPNPAATPWTHPVKTEPDSFTEMFNGPGPRELYQVPD